MHSRFAVFIYALCLAFLCGCRFLPSESVLQTYENRYCSFSLQELPAWNGDAFQSAAYGTPESGSYICYRFPFSISDAPSGELFLSCRDSVEQNQGSYYAAYTIAQGELCTLSPIRFTREVSLLGRTFYIAFEYAACGSQMAITHISSNSEANMDFSILDVSRGPQACLIALNAEHPDGTLFSYPVLIDLETGQITDLLFDIDQAIPLLTGQIYASALGEGGQLVLRLSECGLCLLAPDSETYCMLSQLVGQEITDCALTADKLICWDSSGNYWVINLKTLQAQQVLSGANVVFSAGLTIGCGCSFVLYRDDSNTIHVFDFCSMEDRILAQTGSWVLHSTACYPSSDGRKLMMFHRSEAGIFQFAIYDVDTNCFYDIERSGSGTESSITWTDDSCVIILSQSGTDCLLFPLPRF